MTRPQHHQLSSKDIRIGLLIHAAAYLLVNLLLVAIDFRSPERLWFYWPLLGWGLGLAWHAFAVYRHTGSLNPFTRQ
jgi:hypothetical protein